MKLTVEKCYVYVRQVESLGRTNSSTGLSAKTPKIQKFLGKLRFTKSNKFLQRYLGSVNYYKSYIPRMAELINPFYKLLKAKVSINITSEFKDTFGSVNKTLSDACELALKQPFRGKPVILMTEASFKSHACALMIEDKPHQKTQSKKMTRAPVAFGSKFFSPAQLKMSMYSKDFLATYMAVLEFEHILCESSKPTTVLTHKKSVNLFFPDKN